MQIHILTLFPAMFKGPFSESIIKRAIEKEIVKIEVHNLRDYSADKHKKCDDRPFGGGPGMVLKPEPIFKAVEIIAQEKVKKKHKTILTSPQGRVFTQRIAKELSRLEEIIFICGHYEGVDERVKEIIDDEISIGSYVLSGGELPTMVITDALIRLIPGVLGCVQSSQQESFVKGDLLDHPQYTRPAVFRRMKVPEVIISGDHQAIEDWRKRKAEEKTAYRNNQL
ncbi:MAG: tRNA (guanosine(37)-N1)-methyltransferase TrmD [Candidatus Omnitrophica bacterium]|nr:tRNA (guanosine(37)-N1)-methyltransferase TrmD [Candidatus Omnitrophota bacterium]